MSSKFSLVLALALSCILPASIGLAGENLLANPSFEKGDEGIPSEWTWDPGKANAELVLEPEGARSGRQAVRLVNETDRSPHVYSHLTQSVPVEPNTTYALSCYVKTNQGGTAWIGGGRKWEWRFAFPQETQGWKRVTGKILTQSDETLFTVRILTESPSSGLWVDDVKLEEGTVCTAFEFIPELEPGESRLRLNPLTASPNLIPNGSFERVDGVRPQGWMWDQRNTDAAMALDDTQSHDGALSLKFTNGTPFGSHVYGWFGAVGSVEVKPRRTYTISAYVRSEEEFIAWFGGGEGWKLRVRIPNTRGDWEQVSQTFMTAEDETSFPVMLVTESPTSGFWIDDIQLREGTLTLPSGLSLENPSDFIQMGAKREPPRMHRGSLVQPHWFPERYPPAQWAFLSSVLKLNGCAARPTGSSPSTVRILLRDKRGRTVIQEEGDFPEETNLLSIDLETNISELQSSRLEILAQLIRKGTPVAESRQSLQLVTKARIEALLRDVEKERERLRGLVRQLDKKGCGAHARVTLTVLEKAVDWAREDLSHDRADRAWAAAEDMLSMALKASREAEEILRGERKGFQVPRYVTSSLRLEGPSFVGTKKWPDGTLSEGPVFFVGYGHFSQVREDIERFPGYGCNLCQIEFGPRSVLVEEGRFEDAAIDAFLEVCDRAAQSNVSVNLLLSPHYFPDWALERWPHLKDCKGGFFQFCVHAPESRKVIEDSLRYVIPKIKDHPALHSLCLSNEPISTDLSDCAFVQKAWHEWLEERYKTVELLNRRWGSEFPSFGDIAVPEPFPRTETSVDFTRFNQELFAGFHAWMAGIIHEIAPEIPVHAKIMMGAHFQTSAHGIWCVSPELFGDLSQIHGNDCYCMVNAKGEWINGWRLHQMAYDFQRSMGDKSVFNSENHVIVDRDHREIPPGHLYSCLWQGALHGQGATTIWVWQRTYDHISSLEGSVIHRPRVIEAIGHCALDLNRFAKEMTALQKQPPQIAFLWSQSSEILKGEHGHALKEAYLYANSLGVPLGFVTERQLGATGGLEILPHVARQGKLKALILPKVFRLPTAARKGIDRLTALDLPVVRLEEEIEFEAFLSLASQWPLERTLFLQDGKGDPVYGVEIRSVLLSDGRRLASVSNHLRDPVFVTLTRDGTPCGSKDLVHDKDMPPTFEIEPLHPLLLEVR